MWVYDDCDEDPQRIKQLMWVYDNVDVDPQSRN